MDNSIACPPTTDSLLSDHSNPQAGAGAQTVHREPVYELGKGSLSSDISPTSARNCHNKYTNGPHLWCEQCSLHTVPLCSAHPV